MADLSIPLAPNAIADIFKDVPLTDQHGKPLLPAELFKDGQALVLFGYGGCPMCQEITDSVARIQQDMLKAGQNVPIVVVSVQPEIDREDLKTYVASYYFKGVQQFAGETLPSDPEKRREMGEASHDAAKEKPQSDRILHVVCPPGKAQAQEIQRRIGLITNPDDLKQHSSFITLFDKGKAVKAYRGLPGSGGNPEKYRTELASTISADIQSAQKGALEAPPKNNSAAWNIAAPAIAGLGAGLFAGRGSFSFTAIVAGLLSATGVSFLTQWITGSGVFDSTKNIAPPAADGKPRLHAAATPERDIGVHTVKARQEADSVRIGDLLASVQTQAGSAALPAPALKSAVIR